MSPHIQRNYDNCAAMLPSSDLVTFDFATLIPWVNSGSEILYPQYNELHTEVRDKNIKNSKPKIFRI